MATSDTTNDPVVDKYKEEFKLHWDYASKNYHGVWKNAWKLYNNQRTNRGYNGVADTFVPLTFAIVEGAVANIVGGRPKFTYLPNDDTQVADTKILDSYVSYVWEKGKFQLRTIPWVKDSILYGTGVIYVYWDAELDIPCARNVPLKDFWIDPTVTTIEQAEREGKPCGFRYLTTKQALKDQQVVNEDFIDGLEEEYLDETGEVKKNPRFVPLYDHAAIDKATVYSDSDTDKYDKDMWDGSTLDKDAKKHQVEVVYRCTKDKIIEYINRKEIIREEDNNLGMLPFAVQRDFWDASLFYGRGHVEVIAARQEELNDNENQDLDNMSYYLDNMFRYDPEIEDTITSFRSGPGVGIPARAGQIEFFPKPPDSSKAERKRQEIKVDMREAVGAGEILQGGTAETDKTATEIQAQTLSAGKRFDLNLQSMELDGFERLGALIFELTQLYANAETLVRVVGNKGVRFDTFLKEEYQGKYDVRVQLDASAKSELARGREQQDQMFLQMSQNPHINLLELTKFTLQKRWDLDEDEVELLMSNPGMPGEPQPGDPQIDPNTGLPIEELPMEEVPMEEIPMEELPPEPPRETAEQAISAILDEILQ